MLTANVGSNQGAKYGAIQDLVVADAAPTIWRGAIVVVRLTTGYAWPAVDDPADNFHQLVKGYALEKSASGGVDRKVRVRVDGKYLLSCPGATQQYVGRLALVKDDNTVQILTEEPTDYVSSEPSSSDQICRAVVGRISEVKTLGVEVFVDFEDRPIRWATSMYD